MQGTESIMTKMRPRVFSEIVGQKLIVDDLKKMFKTGAVPRTFVLRGVSGSGKTSTAVIMSAALNCTQPLDVEPCGKCSNCKSIFGATPDSNLLLYKDGASMGKAEVENLRHEIGGMSVSLAGSHQLVIIDEAQELSSKAFGPLLTLLEDCDNGKFGTRVHIALCTMADQTLGKAIESRCQTYIFRPLNKEELLAVGIRLIERFYENREFDQEKFLTETLPMLYDKAQGSARDFLNSLDYLLRNDAYEDLRDNYKQWSAVFTMLLVGKFSRAVAEFLGQADLGELRGMIGVFALRSLENMIGANADYWTKDLTANTSATVGKAKVVTFLQEICEACYNYSLNRNQLLSRIYSASLNMVAK